MESERMGDLDQKRELEKAFEPIVTSNTKMTMTIAEDLAPIARELENLNKSLQQPKLEQVGKFANYGPLANEFVDQYLDNSH